MTPGYIYILQNESLAETHLKIGKTEKEPELMASDIPRGTGGLTPFETVWFSATDDCVEAERIVHRLLDKYRPNPNRNFFDVKLSKAIKAAKRAVEQTGGSVISERSSGSSREEGIVAFLFHSVLRRIIRLPVELPVSGFHFVVKAAFRDDVFGGSRRQSRKRKVSTSNKRVNTVVKDILGLLIWLALIAAIVGACGGFEAIR